ncbi:toprim domain-containing protein [Nostoc punctiforme]|uniref:toprim domain-containing protein n=1 Tax=Nostoc punctiforme TaxID=272131 RepID=UPI000045C0E1|nr:toprim domain-containing protein [Nostoc punctiforme]
MAADSVISIPTSEFFTKIPTIIAAYDNDATADQIAKQIREILPHAKRLRPTTKDWNEQLIQQLNF